jgi:polysaccharide deacetylase 2 family uncharacterized protein YibQ
MRRPQLRRLGALKAPQAGLIWIALTALLTLGVISNLVALSRVGTSERARAEAHDQRLVFDALTGELLTRAAGNSAAKAPSFDIAPDEETPVKSPTEAEAEAEAEVEAETKTQVATESTDDKLPESAPVIEAAPEAAAAVASDVVADTAEALPALPVAEDIPMPVMKASAESLVAAPAPEVSAKTPQGLMPAISESGTRPSTLYARRFKPAEDALLLSIVVKNLGFNARVMGIALSLPAPVSFAISPYAPDTEKIIQSARNGGFETWLMLPTQTSDYPEEDPGALAVIASLSDQARETRMRQWLLRANGAVGAVLPCNESLSLFPDAMDTAVASLAKHGLALFSCDNARAKRIGNLPEEYPLRAGDIHIAAGATNAQAASSLAKIPALLEEKGAAILVIDATPAGLRALKKFLSSLSEESKIQLAPLSAMYRDEAAEAAKEAAAAAQAEKEKESAGGGH